jgi:hypothetical protein
MKCEISYSHQRLFSEELPIGICQQNLLQYVCETDFSTNIGKEV